jgi:biotin synthase
MSPVSPLLLRHDWSLAEIHQWLQTPLLELLHHAHTIHRQHNPLEIQRATLLSVKTGGCTEDCGYCAQSIHYDTDLDKPSTLSVTAVVERAQQAKQAGATRFCMGWAWREIREGKDFEAMLEMVQQVRALGMEACVTAGMLNQSQANRLAAAGLTAYNHNLDTSPEFYPQVIQSRTYEDRLATLECVHRAGISVCCGGILGLGETWEDRARLLQTLANLDPHPESVPINVLVPIEGTPLAQPSPVDALDLVRMCATARILMPKARVRLSAGRSQLNREAQILCFLAGANSIFYGDKLLTTGNPDCQNDQELLAALL